MPTLRNYLKDKDADHSARLEALWFISKGLHEGQAGSDGIINGRLHCEAVESNMWEFIKRRIDTFKPKEIFLLSCAACCHDFDKGLRSVLDEGTEHGVGSGRFVYDNNKEFILSRAESIAIDSIISIHSVIDDDFASRLRNISTAFPIPPAHSINLQRLALIMKAADILHLDSSRVNESSVNLDTLNEIQKIKFLSRKCVTGWEVDGTRVTVSAYPELDTELDALQKSIDYIQEKEWGAISSQLSLLSFPFRLEFNINETYLNRQREGSALSASKNIALLFEKNSFIEYESIAKYLNHVCVGLHFEAIEIKCKLPGVMLSPDATEEPWKTIYEGYKDFYYVFVFTKKQYANNYFFKTDLNLCITSFAHWELLTTLPKENGAVYFIVDLLALTLSDSFRHKETTGCIYDFLWDKTGVDIGMRGAFICPACQNRILPSISGDNKSIFDNTKILLNDLGSASKWNDSIIKYWSSKYGEV